MYRQLLTLMDEERNAKELLKLPIQPRLSVVDEERVAVLRPIDRQGLGLDQELQRAREQLTDERETESSGG